MRYSKIEKIIYVFVAIMLTSKVGQTQINTPSGATKPFGSNTSYEYGMMPSNLPTSGSYGKASEIASIYNQWKTDYVENCGSDKARVKFDNTSETVSEGIGYGMLLAAYAADKDLFNRLWAYYKQHRNSHGVMHWKISGCNSVIGQNGATDAELDAAMALIVANYQWPNTTSPHNYKTDAVALINAIKTMKSIVLMEHSRMGMCGSQHAEILHTRLLVMLGYLNFYGRKWKCSKCILG